MEVNISGTEAYLVGKATFLAYLLPLSASGIFIDNV
jgi:hypothetical protein